MPHSSQLNTELLEIQATFVTVQATFVTATSITTQPRHDCEKIAITGLEPVFQGRST